MKKAMAVSAIALAISGCASIFNGSTQPVTITSLPEGSSVSVANRAGQVIHTGITPVTLTLKRGAGYFQSEQYVVTVKKDGFATREMTITGNVNGWYIGNILFGGLIGMLAVDPATGAMYSFPDSVSTTLEAQPGQPKQAGSLTIISTEGLSEAVMQQARLVATVQ